MGRKKIFACERCNQLFQGRAPYDYHLNAHKRTDPPKPKPVRVPPRRVWYADDDGNKPVT